MRASLLPIVLAATSGLAGCLSAPTGRDPAQIDAADDATDAAVDAAENVWPPTAANIVAIAAGDLDGDGKDDIVAADQASARVYLLRGGVDIDPTRAAVTTTSDSAPLAGLRPPAAATIARNGATPYVVILDNPPSGPRFTVFDATLTMVSQPSAGQTPAASGAVVTVTQTKFGMNMNAVFGSLPDAVFFIEGSALSTANPNMMQLPENGTPFASVMAIGGYVATGAPNMPTVVVSELDHAQKAVSTGPGVFNYTTVRAVSATWTSQTAADITGDTYADIVGFNPDSTNPADICLLDAQAGATNCVDTPFGMDTATIVVGPVVAANQNDVILAHVNPGNLSMTSVFVVPRLRMSGTLMSDAASSPAMFPVMNGLLALAQLDTAGKEIILVGTNGSVACSRSNGGAPVPCSQ